MPGKPSTNGKPSTSGTPAPVATKDTSDSLATFAGGKPDKKAYEAEQAKIKIEIDTLQAQLVTDMIANESGNTHSLTSEYRPRQDRFCDQIWSWERPKKCPSS